MKSSWKGERMIGHKEKPDDGTWFRHNDDVYESFYTVREFSHPHVKVMAYIIQRTWGHTQGKAKRQRPVFALDLKDAMEKTGLGASFCSYYYALMNAYVLYEDEGLVGVENHREWWELDRLKANPKLAKKVLMADAVFLQQRTKILQRKMEILQQRTLEAEEARNKTVSEPSKEYKNNKKTTLGEKGGKKTKGSEPKDTPDNQPDPINTIATKLYDTFAEKRGYKKPVDWLKLK